MAKRTGQYTSWILPFIFAVAGVLSSSCLWAGSLLVSWNPVQDSRLAGYKIHYGTSTGSYTQIADAGKATSLMLTNLTEGTTYYMVVTGYDVNQVEGTPSLEASGAVLLVSNVASNSSSCNSAVITWSTNKGATSQVEYGISTTYGFSTVQDSSLLTNHSQTLTNLTPGTTYNYRIKSTDAGGTLSVSSNYTFTTTKDSTAPPADSVPILQINSGGSAASPFLSDKYYSGGTTYSVPYLIDTTAVTNPAPSSVYQSERYGSFTYTLPNLVAGAAYTLRLHFAENYWAGAGQRRFSVAINGTQVLAEFDIFAAAGAQNKAVIRQFPAIADSKGQIVIQYLPGSIDQPKSSGIEVYAAPVPGVAAVNAGGDAAGIFKADANYSGGSMASFANVIDTANATNPAPAEVYQSERSGNSFTYTFPGLAPGAAYTLRLHFAENYWTAAGKRVFDVSVNGAKVLSNFDIVAAAGAPYKAVVRQSPVVANNSGQLAISFTQGAADLPSVCGIEVLASTISTVTAVNSGGAAAGTFKADGYYKSGSTYNTSSAITLTGISNPAPQAVYQSERFGSFTYTIPNLSPGAAYIVRLHFAEIYFTAANMRKFNVLINGTKVLNNFDIFATVGAQNKAIYKQFPAFPNSKGQIVIQYAPGSADNPKSSGIEILK